MRGEESTPPGSRVWLTVVLTVGILAYGIAIVNRTSLSAVGVETANRFGLDAATLSLFAVLQLAVYGAMQIPVGLLLDRFGPRPMLVAGMLLMAVAQVAMALAPNAGLAIAARLLLGAGDATIFPSLLRVISARFSSRTAPLIGQTVAVIGGFGQIVSVVPFAALLRATNWPTAFLCLAGTTVFAGALAWIVIREAAPARAEEGPRALIRALGQAWRRPGTRMAFWTHFGTLGASNAFAVLWGFPFLTAGESVPQATAAELFSLFVVVGAIAGPVIGWLSGRLPAQRGWLAVGLIVGLAVPWLVVVAWPGTVPVWMLVVLAVAIGTGGPASMIAFDVARSHNPPLTLSTATGIVNGGGFLSSVLIIAAMGLALDLQGAGTPDSYTQGAFRIAFLTPVPIWAVSVWAILRESSRAHRIRLLQGTYTSPISTIER